MTISKNLETSCIILAGGEGKRVGGQDKGLVRYKGQVLIATVINSIKDQVDDIVISANRNIDAYRNFSHHVIKDSASEYRGPLSGIAASLPYCQHSHVLIVACDMPTLPDDLVSRLSDAIERNDTAIATIGGRHQLVMLINKNSRASIQQRLDDNRLKLIQWVESTSYRTVSFDDKAEAFININRLPDLDG